MKKKFGILMVAAFLLTLLLCATALACPNPNQSCSGTIYHHTYLDEDSHELKCKKCGYTFVQAHWGGNATCTKRGTCKGCGRAYISKLGHDWSEWVSNGDDTHTRICKNDGSHVERLACSGGTATCIEQAVCESCGIAYGDSDPSAHNWGEWVSNGDDTHTRTCKNDGTHSETTACSGGTANCTEQAVCEDCGEAYGDVDPDAHDWGEWESEGRDKSDGHVRICERNSGHYEEEDHTGGNPTCNESAVCTVCLIGYFDMTNHGDNETSEWMPMPDGAHHYKLCLGCGNNHTVAPHDYTIPATCTEQAVCEGCGEPYGDALGHAPGAAATCTTDQVCTRDGCGVVLNKKLGHAPGDAATCTTDQVCTRDGCGAVLTPTNGHSYESKTVEPTCTDLGYTRHTCSVCKDTYTDSWTGARSHWYDLWRPNADGTHSADCRRHGCEYVGAIDCTLFEVTVKDGETEAILTICPVCGEYEETLLDVIPEAAIRAAGGYALPRGEQIVRGADAPFDGVLYAFTAAYELAGRVEPFEGTAAVTIPLKAGKYAGFRLVRVDVTPATEEAERTEVWTDIAFAYDDGKLTFKTDVAGLFLLLPAE